VTLEETIVAAPIIGYRHWFVRADGQLRALTMDYLWAAGKPLLAQCRQQYGEPSNRYQLQGSHDPPHSVCPCGIYAFKQAPAADELWMDRMFDGTGGTPYIFGAVLLWGRIVEHERGYRAQYARVAALAAGHPRAGVLAERYGVGLVAKGAWPCG
jgi:hypothetical protein